MLDICSQPAKTGPCRGNFQRWYFDVANDSCMPFTFGGCKGNDNQFSSLQECQTHCTPSVLQGRHVEPSDLSFLLQLFFIGHYKFSYDSQLWLPSYKLLS